MKVTSVDDFLARKVAPEHRAVVARLRALMKRHAPGTREEVAYGILAWKRRRIVAVINATKRHVTFAFSGGAHFTDSYGLLQGAGKVSRHVKLTSLADVNATALRDYIRQALAFDNRD